MNFLLQNLELALDEQHLLVGEKLFEQGKVSNLFEGERNLWLARVDGFETEIQVSPSRVKASSCECEIYLAKKMCGHVAAALLALRRHFSDKKFARKTEKPLQRIHHKLTVAAILDSVGKDDLLAFIGKYAKQNRQFSLALFTRFASAVPLADNTEKYRLILHSVIGASKKKNEWVSIVGTKQVAQVWAELAGQADDSVALEHYAEGWAVLQASIESLPVVLRKVEGETAVLEALAKSMFQRVADMLSLPIAPELKTEVWDFCIAECTKNQYRVKDLATHFFPILTVLADSLKRKAILFDTLQMEWSKRADISENHLSGILTSMLKLFAFRHFQPAAKTFFATLGTDPKMMFAVAKTACSTGHFSVAKQLVASGLAIVGQPMLQQKFQALSLELAIAEGDTATAIILAGHRFIESKELLFFRQVKTYSGSNWANEFKSLIDKTNELPTGEKDYLLPLIYAEEKKLADLELFLLSKNSLELLMQFDHHFLPTEKKALTALYQALLDQYLGEHYGVKPSEKILKIFDHLRHIGAADIVQSLAAYVRKKFPRRMELAMELMAV